MTPAFLTDAEYDEQLAEGRRLLEISTLAYAFADTGTATVLRDCCETARVGESPESWIDTMRVKESKHEGVVELATRYLALRGLLELHPQIPTLVLVLTKPTPAPTEGSTAR